MPGSKSCIVDENFLEDLKWWIANDRKRALRVMELIEAALRDPFQGIGKPEHLKHLGPGTWSRRITQADRLVYRVFDDRVVFLQARYHY